MDGLLKVVQGLPRRRGVMTAAEIAAPLLCIGAEARTLQVRSQEQDMAFHLMRTYAMWAADRLHNCPADLAVLNVVLAVRCGPLRRRCPGPS